MVAWRFHSVGLSLVHKTLMWCASKIHAWTWWSHHWCDHTRRNFRNSSEYLCLCNGTQIRGWSSTIWHTSEIMALSLQMRYLHEQPCGETLPYVRIVLWVAEVSSVYGQVQFHHNPLQLLPHTVRWRYGSMVYEVFVTPIFVTPVLFVRMISIQQRQMIPILINTGDCRNVPPTNSGIQ